MKNQSGQTIIEVLVATAIVSVLLVSLLILGTNSLKSTNYAKDLNRATEYSNQAADWIRSRKEAEGWETFLSTLEEDTTGNQVSYCLDTLIEDSSAFRALEGGSCGPEDTISQTIYTRYIDFDLSSSASGIISATITTQWQDNAVRHATVYITLAQWK